MFEYVPVCMGSLDESDALNPISPRMSIKIKELIVALMLRNRAM